MSSNNPLLENYDTPFNAVPFDRIKTEHFLPAIETGINKAKKNIAEVRNNQDDPTFENTVLALETCSEMMDRCSQIYFNLYSSHADKELQDLVDKISPLLAEFRSDIYLDFTLYSRIKSVYDNRDQLPPDDARLTEVTHKEFFRNGANLNDEKKEELRAINKELSVYSPWFSKNVLAATNDFELWITDGKELDGLPENAIVQAKESAVKKGRDDAWLITLQFPSYMPFMKYAHNRELRKELCTARLSLCKDGEFSNVENIKTILALKYKRANLLGFETFADYTLSDRMAESTANVMQFLEDLYGPSLKAARSDLAELEAFAFKMDGIEDLKIWDIPYYQEKLKEQKFGIDEETLRPYFSADNVVQGVFNVANKLYGLTFKQNQDIPVYHEDVKVFEVYAENGDYIGLLYSDLYPRSTKKSGAWMNVFRNQGLSFGKIRRPHVTFTCNLTKPTGGKPSLLTLNEVTTIFHEFGHCLHGLLSQCKYTSIAGANVKWDFVELPSQIMENWVMEQDALNLFAQHYKTGEKLSQDLIDKIKSSRQYMAGWSCLRQLQFAFLDMAWYTTEPDQIDDLFNFEKDTNEKTNLVPPVEGSFSSGSFSHIFAGGYSAGYYSYKWAEVLEADAFESFKENGIFDRDTADSFRCNILEKGNSESAMKLYVDFKGRKPTVDALLKREGLDQFMDKRKA